MLETNYRDKQRRNMRLIKKLRFKVFGVILFLSESEFKYPGTIKIFYVNGKYGTQFESRISHLHKILDSANISNSPEDNKITF